MHIFEQKHKGDGVIWVAPRHVPAGAACSGTGAPRIVIEAIGRASKRRSGAAVATHFNLQWLHSCEIAVAKAEFIIKLHQDDTCVFKGICGPHRGSAACWAHGGKCVIGRCRLFVAVFSCKGLGPSNKNRGPNRSVLVGEASPGGSATTWTGVRAYLGKFCPGIIVLENPDALAQDCQQDVSDTEADKQNRGIINSELAARSYEFQWVIAGPRGYGHPARRRGVYIVGLRPCLSPVLGLSGRGGFDGFSLKVLEFMELCKLDPCRLEDLLCSDNGENRLVLLITYYIYCMLQLLLIALIT